MRPKATQTGGRGAKGAGDSSFERNNALLKLIQIMFNNNDIDSCERVLNRLNCRLNSSVQNGWVSWQQIASELKNNSIDVCIYKPNRFKTECYDKCHVNTQKWIRVLDVCNGEEIQMLKDIKKGDVSARTEAMLDNDIELERECEILEQMRRDEFRRAVVQDPELDPENQNVNQQISNMLAAYSK